MHTLATKPRILLTGATGYVGGRLLRALQRDGYPVRCLARRPEFLASRVDPETEIVGGDCLDAASLPAACSGVHTAYYLVHSMGSGGDFVEQDRQAALNFGASARRAGIRRIIYLGGLADHTARLSTHLRSRHETGTARGRRHPEDLAVGDAVDFWRVEAYEPGRRLRLVAEMKLPGRAWLEFDVQPDGDGALIRQTAVFDPVGLLGLSYWYGIYPLHARVFAGMLRGLALRAEQSRDSDRSHPPKPVSRPGEAPRQRSSASDSGHTAGALFTARHDRRR